MADPYRAPDPGGPLPGEGAAGLPGRCQGALVLGALGAALALPGPGRTVEWALGGLEAAHFMPTGDVAYMLVSIGVLILAYAVTVVGGVGALVAHVLGAAWSVRLRTVQGHERLGLGLAVAHGALPVLYLLLFFLFGLR